MRPRRRVIITRAGRGEGARWVRTRKRGHVNDDASSCRCCREDEVRMVGDSESATSSTSRRCRVRCEVDGKE